MNIIETNRIKGGNMIKLAAECGIPAKEFVEIYPWTIIYSKEIIEVMPHFHSLDDFDLSEFLDIRYQWCKDNCTGLVRHWVEFFVFAEEGDALAFKMMWG